MQKVPYDDGNKPLRDRKRYLCHRKMEANFKNAPIRRLSHLEMLGRVETTS